MLSGDIIRPIAGGGGGGGSGDLNQAVAQWAWDTTNTEADPGAGTFRMDNDAWASVTQMWIDDLAAEGIDASSIIENWQQGGFLMIQQSDDPDAAAIFSLDADPTDDTGYYDLSVTYVSDSGTAPTDTKSFIFTYLSPIRDFIQFKYAQSQSAGSTTTLIPSDSTIPQNTEGAEWITLAITPKASGNDLIIEFSAMFDVDGGTRLSIALFVDTTASAIATASIRPDTSNRSQTITLRHRVTAGSTTARTYKIRYGPSAGTAMIGRSNGNATLHGNMNTSLLAISEVRP